MKTAAADSLGFSELANAWAAEPGIRSHEYVLDQLLSAFWTGEFENIPDSTPENWPDHRTTYRVLEICGGVPTEGLPFEDDVRPEPEALAGVVLDAYPAPGRAVMDSVELPRDMIRLWCLDQGYDPPKFWFPEDEDKKFVGRPSVKHRLLNQMELRAERRELKETLAEEARALHDWAENNLRHEFRIPKSRSIENALRGQYRHLKHQDQTR